LALRTPSVVYYDDLDADSLNGGVALYASAFGRLWSICAEARRMGVDSHRVAAVWIQGASALVDHS
jgi:hypothetical protein